MVGSPRLSRPLSGVGDGDSGPLLTAACQQYAGQNDTEMRRTSRLFEIIQLLRSARKPLTAAALAQRSRVIVIGSGARPPPGRGISRSGQSQSTADPAGGCP